jgi:hypothetical protein
MVLAGCGSDDGPAGYVGHVSNAVVYVSWTKAKDSLSGQLTQARANDDVSKGTVTTDRVSFDGTIAGKSVSIRLDQGFGSTSTLTGTLKGKALLLDYPGTGGGVTTITLRKGDSAAFNRALTALQAKSTQAKQDADQAAAEQQAREQASQLADGVRSAIGSLDQAAENATANSPDVFQADLDNLGNDLDTVKVSYELIKQDLENGYTVCDDVGSVSDDVDTLKSDIKSMHDEVKSNSDTSVLSHDVDDLRQQFAQMRAVDPSVRPSDAPTQNDVDTAIRAARRKVRSRAAKGANFTKAQALLSQAQTIKAKADAACHAHGG